MQVGTTADGSFEVHGARFGFDDAAFRSSGRQKDIQALRNIAEEVREEVEAEKDGIVYIKFVRSYLEYNSMLTGNRLEGEGSVGTLGIYFFFAQSPAATFPNIYHSQRSRSRYEYSRRTHDTRWPMR